MTLKNFFQCLGAIILCQAAGLIGTIFTMDAIPTWYANIVRPALNPPSWIFGPVWTLLYTLMGIALYIVWKKRDAIGRKKALTVFGIQLVLNAIWSIIFFGLKETGWAFVDISLMWIFILYTIVVFYKISRPAAYLLLPYIVWVSFAAYLNFAIWRLN